MFRTNRLSFPALLALTVASSCGGSGADASTSNLNADRGAAGASRPQDSHEMPPYPGAANFVSIINNQYLPFTPGKTFRYRSETEDGVETTIVEVTHDKKTIIGVETTVVRDRVFLDGELIEDTLDWYAQDKNGNVWYFGEDTKEYEDGEVVSTQGSWEAGVNGAKPGIIMLARPRVGMKYFQEHAPGAAEDRAMVMSLTSRVSVPYGKFTNCLKTSESTPLDYSARELKYYAPGVGPVLTTSGSGGIQRDELVSVSTS